jgi:chloramphenicol 3-O phosphotransferase
MQNGRIILLNGTSSAGKSTLAKALQAALPPFCYYASDQLADAGFRTPIRSRADTPGLPTERDRFFDGFHRSIPAFAAAGNDMVIEHIVEEPSWATQLQHLLAPFDVFWVGVHAPLAELERRERERGNRTVGEASYHLKTHTYCQYDLEVDTTEAQEANVNTIINAWNSRPGGPAG